MHVFVTLSTKFTSAESVHKNHRILVSVFVYHRILVRVVQKKKPKPHEDLSIDEHHEEATKAAEAPENARQEISFSKL